MIAGWGADFWAGTSNRPHSQKKYRGAMAGGQGTSHFWVDTEWKTKNNAERAQHEEIELSNRERQARKRKGGISAGELSEKGCLVGTDHLDPKSGEGKDLPVGVMSEK